MKMESLQQKFSQIKLLITDVDGVLTDGGLYYSSEGLIMKKFNVKDGMGTHLLRQHNIKYGVISTDTADLISKRAERLKMDFLFTEVWDKEQKLIDVCKQFNVDAENVAFIGDDINDIEIIKKVGVSAAPADAVPEIIQLVDFVCSNKGGHGAFREFVDMIISSRN